MKPAAKSDQLGFDQLLAAADGDNARRIQEKACDDLPDTFGEALPYLRSLIARHHAFMVAANMDEAMALREAARRVAYKLNGFKPGILAGPDAPGCALERLAAAPKGTVPLWGQRGSFVLDINGMRVRIAMDGVYGICTNHSIWPGFGAHIVERDKPFLSGTGYRSFLGLCAELPSGQTPDSFARIVIESHVRHELKGKLVSLGPQYRNGSAVP